MLRLSLFALAFVSLFSSLAFAQTEEEIALSRLKTARALIEKFEANPNSVRVEKINLLISSTLRDVSGEQIADFLRTIPAQAKIRKNFSFRIATEQYNPWLKRLDELRTALVGTKFFRRKLGYSGRTCDGYEVILGSNGIAYEKRLVKAAGSAKYEWVSSQTTWTVKRDDSDGWDFPHYLYIGKKDFRLNDITDGFRIVYTGENRWILNDTRTGALELSSSDGRCYPR